MRDDLVEYFDSAGGGAFVGYAWGEGANSFLWGLEAFASVEIEQPICANEPRTVFGPVARLSVHGASRPIFTLAAHAGREVERASLGFGAEAGLSLGFPGGLEQDVVLGPHSGFIAESIIFNVFARQEWLLESYSVGGGVRILPTFGAPSFCVVGRPQRDCEGRQHPADGAKFPHGSLDGRAALAHDWRRQAAEEYESVPAFFQLALELTAARAPASLVLAALRAAFDELRHTALCSEFASLYGGPHLLAVPRPLHRAPLTGKAAIERLARESWLDGCLGEGLAAALATEEARVAREPAVARSQAIIARDERRHAELGWDIVRWCLDREPGLRHALAAHQNQPLEAPPMLSGNVEQRRQMARRHRKVACERLAALC